MAYKLVGQDFTPPDVLAKVTGQAKYSEDVRAEGMLHGKMVVSPMPHARVRSIDASAAKAMPGVIAIITPEDVPQFPEPQDPILYSEPTFVGAPIAAVVAGTEEIAAAAVEAIKVQFEQLKHTVDPLDTLFPGGANARANGNVANMKVPFQTVKWTARDFAGIDKGRLPMGKPAVEWSYGDLDAGFAKAAVVVEESFVTNGNSHHSMEPRSTMAYWQNGKCFVYGSTQSQAFILPGLAAYVGVKPEDLVYISEFCGGGFGSKGTAYPVLSMAAHLSKKAGGRPVMLRMSREDEYAQGSGRAGMQGYAKIGFAKNGRITSFDLYVIQDNGPNTGFVDFENVGHAASVLYQPETMRYQGIPVLTNTPPRGPQRGPGENQASMALEPLIDEGARKLGLDRMEIRKVNAPGADGKEGENQGPLTSAYIKDALDKGAELFGWAEKSKLSGTKTGNKVIGVGVGQAFHPGGSIGFDGLMRIMPDGKLYVHTGVGNLGTFSYASTSRVAAEVLGYDWKDVVIVRGRSDNHLPWNIGQFGSNSTYTMSRTNYAAAMDAKQKLLEIAAKDLGGAPGDYDLKDQKVVSKDGAKSMDFAQAAKRAIELGGTYSGKDLPADINPMTRASATAMAGSGLIGVAKDKMPRTGLTPAMAAGYCMIELDTETGAIEIKEYTGVADCGTVVHPQGLHAQIRSGAVMGFSFAMFERIVLDPALGTPATAHLYQAKPASWLDVPKNMKADAVGKPDASNPMGAKGIGEPVAGAAASALLCAISDALKGHMFNRVPVVRDMIINALANRPQSTRPLSTNTM